MVFVIIILLALDDCLQAFHTAISNFLTIAHCWLQARYKAATECRPQKVNNCLIDYHHIDPAKLRTRRMRPSWGGLPIKSCLLRSFEASPAVRFGYSERLQTAELHQAIVD